MAKNENLEMVQGIVDDLQTYASGDYFLHNGELFPIDKEEFKLIDGCSIVDDDCYVFSDGDEVYEGDVEPASLFDYFTDYLDVDYIIDSQKQFKAVRVMVTCGGPNIYINTWSREVQLFWWTERATAVIPANICDKIDDIFQEFYYC